MFEILLYNSVIVQSEETIAENSNSRMWEEVEGAETGD